MADLGTPTVRRDAPTRSGPEASRFEQLRLDNVTRVFGQTQALRGLDITIDGGEFIAFLGPSGSGKSTALNCLAGLLELTDGAIWMDGRRIDTLPPERRGFGMVFQNYALFPHMSVERNVGFGLRMRGASKSQIAAKVGEALELVQLAGHASKLPQQLSGGEQQRVALARAVALEPPLVLMDEPLSNLDAKLRLDMRTEIRRLHQDLSLTTVYVTHDQQEALSLADRVVLLRKGRTEQIGTPEQIYTTPASAFVATFIGYRNLFDGRLVSRDQDGAVAETAGFRATGTTTEDLRPGDDAAVGIRPEDLKVTTGEGPAGGCTMRARVQVVEFAGREYAVQGVTGADLPVHFLADEPLTVGAEVTLEAPTERVRLFRPDPAAAGEVAEQA